MNRYKQAFNDIYKNTDYSDYTKNTQYVIDEAFGVIKELVDKEKPIKPKTIQNEHLGIDYICRCGKVVQKYDYYCSRCGQRLR